MRIQIQMQTEMEAVFQKPDIDMLDNRVRDKCEPMGGSQRRI